MLIFLWVRFASKEHFYVNVGNSTRLEHVDEVKKCSKLEHFAGQTEQVWVNHLSYIHLCYLKETEARKRGDIQRQRETVREKIHKY